MNLTAALLGPVLAGPSAAQPLITYYDDATGERIELSGITTANWAAKSANLLRDECDVEPGTRVAMLLPAHWQTAAVLLAAWWCGAEVVGPPGTMGPGAEWVLCDAQRVDRALGAQPAGGVVALSLDPFGTGVTDLPATVLDFATEVRLHGDEFVPEEPASTDVPVLAGATARQVLDDARERATALGIGAGDRVLSTLDWNSAGDLGDGLLAVLAAGASLVQCRNPDPTKLDARVAAERVTTRLSGT